MSSFDDNLQNHREATDSIASHGMLRGQVQCWVREDGSVTKILTRSIRSLNWTLNKRLVAAFDSLTDLGVPCFIIYAALVEFPGSAGKESTLPVTKPKKWTKNCCTQANMYEEVFFVPHPPGDWEKEVENQIKTLYRESYSGELTYHEFRSQTRIK